MFRSLVELEKELTLLADKTIMSHGSSVADAINEKYRADALSVFRSGLSKLYAICYWPEGHPTFHRP